MIGLVSVCLFLSVLTVIYCFIQNNWIEIENIKIEIDNLPKELSGIKIVHISDVHLPKNASNIGSLVNKVKQQKPEIIVLTGDIIDGSKGLGTTGLDIFCKEISKIAKTYAVTGNHELNHVNIGEWTSMLTANNIEVIDNKIALYTKENKNIAIVGLMDGCKYKPENLRNINKIRQIPMLLLAHRPELFSSYSSSLNKIKPNVVFSGHAHGGQFRIPIINQGLYAPNQGLFPKYTSGLYSDNDVIMIVSRGLGSSSFPIRLNNRPHLPIIELVNLKHYI